MSVAIRVGAGEPSVLFDVQPRVVSVGETAVATLTLRDVFDASTPSLPDLDGFQVQPAGTENRMNIVNGVVDKSIVHRFALTAVRAGEFTLGPFSYEAGGKQFQLDAVKVRVVSAPADGGAPVDDLRHAAFARVTVNQSEVYVHETFTITIEMLHRGVDLDRDVQLLNMPQSGLKLGQFVELGSGREVVEGTVYEVRAFRAEGRALTAGEIRLEPVLRAQRVTRRQGRARGPFGESLFDDFFGRVERRPIDLKTQPVTLNVLPLPVADRPATFSGAVGACTWDVDVKPLEVNAGEPVTLTMTIRGGSNLEMVTAPHVEFGEEFRVYAPRMISPADQSAERVFEQIVIPRDDRAGKIPALSFSYFDPEVGEYRTVERGPFPLVVHASTNGASVIHLTPTPAGPLVSGGAPDIVYLKPSLAVTDRAGVPRWLTTWPGAMVHLAPAIFALAAWGFARRREALQTDVARARRQRAPRAARVAVRKARDAAEKGDGAAFHDAVWEALTGYFGNRLNLAPGEVDLERVLASFRAGKAETALLSDIRMVFESADAARFAGGGAAGAAGLRDRLDLLVRLLSQAERVRI